MPNHIQNRLVVKANQVEELKMFLDAIRGFDSEDNFIDFNKIIPMPEEIKNTESSSKVDDAIYYYLVNTEQEWLINKILKYSISRMDRFANFSQEELNEMFAIGQQYVNNWKRYGAKDWYDWSRINWGTKWNAYNTDLEYIDECEVVIYFQTAWSGVPDIIAEITERFPTLTFEYAYSDEDMGYNCGKGYGEDGEFSYMMLEGGSDEAMEIYALCWDYDFDAFYQDEDGHWHNREWEDDSDF